MSIFPLFFSLVLVMCASKVLAIKRYNSIAGPFKIDIKRIGKCPAGGEGPNAASFDFKERKGYHEPTAYSFNVSLPFAIDDKLVLKGNLASWSTNGGWKPNAYQATIKTPCTMWFRHFRGHLEHVLKHLFGEVIPCPFYPGIYRVNNITIPDRLTSSSSMTFIRQFLYGKWRGDGWVYTEDGEMVFCVRCYADTVPN